MWLAHISKFCCSTGLLKMPFLFTSSIIFPHLPSSFFPHLPSSYHKLWLGLLPHLKHFDNVNHQNWLLSQLNNKFFLMGFLTVCKTSVGTCFFSSLFSRDFCWWTISDWHTLVTAFSSFIASNCSLFDNFFCEFQLLVYLVSCHHITRFVAQCSASAYISLMNDATDPPSSWLHSWILLFHKLHVPLCSLQKDFEPSWLAPRPSSSCLPRRSWRNLRNP